MVEAELAITWNSLIEYSSRFLLEHIFEVVKSGCRVVYSIAEAMLILEFIEFTCMVIGMRPSKCFSDGRGEIVNVCAMLCK